MLSIDEALRVYPELGSSERAQISRSIFLAESDVSALVYGACVVSGLALDESGNLAPGELDPAASAARFLELVAADKGAAKRFDKALKATLDDARRHAAMVHAMYRLGFALTPDGKAERA